MEGQGCLAQAQITNWPTQGRPERPCPRVKFTLKQNFLFEFSLAIIALAVLGIFGNPPASAS